MQNELSVATMKELAPMTNAGMNLADIPMAAALSSTGMHDPQTAQASLQSVLLKAAQTAEANAKAAHAGDAGAPTTTVQVMTDPQGRPVGYTLTGKGHDPSAVIPSALSATGEMSTRLHGVAPQRGGVMYPNTPGAATTSKYITPQVSPGGTITFAPNPQAMMTR
jgi:hypothetical protein